MTSILHKILHCCKFQSLYKLYVFFSFFACTTVFQMVNWPQNLRFCIFDLQFAQHLTIFAHFWEFISYLCLKKCIDYIVSFVKAFVLSIYVFIVFQMSTWHQNLRVCILDLHFAQNVALFTAFRDSITYLCHEKYILVLFSLWNHFSVHLWVYSVPNGKLAPKFTILYFDLIFAQNVDLFATSRAPTTYLCFAECIFSIVC